MESSLQQISKSLTPNDIGLTGSHQAGITVPKNGDMLEFFPALDATIFNPRIMIPAYDVHCRQSMKLSFIYYNGKIHGRSTRNEFRLTGLSGFFHRNEARDGDNLMIARLDDNRYELRLERLTTADEISAGEKSLTKIKLTGKWSTYKRR